MFNFKFYLLPLLILSIELSGCTKLNKDVSKTLSIVIEPAFKEQVLDAVKYATSKNNSLEFEIKILSPDPDKRSAEIQKLRTQIMSGKGPDLYLVNCSTDGAGDEQEGADAASGHRTDTADDHNQQNLIGHCRLEHGSLNGSLIHGQQTS